MGATAARRTREVIVLMQRVIAGHLLALCQAADFRGADGLGVGTRAAYDAVRRRCTFVDLDRELDGDLRELEALVRSGDLTECP